MENSNETVTISKKEYQALINDSAFLSCLQSAGVDNWDGYDLAVELMNEKEQ